MCRCRAAASAAAAFKQSFCAQFTNLKAKLSERRLRVWQTEENFGSLLIVVWEAIAVEAVYNPELRLHTWR